MSDRDAFIVKKQVTMKAGKSKVWEALTNPELTKKYFFNCAVLSDWKVGSPITFKGRLFFIMPIKLKGTIVQIEPGKLLKYTLENRRSGTTSTVTDKLSSANGQTTLTITDDVGQGQGAEKRFRRSQKGWDKILSGLKSLVEKENS